MAAFVIDSFTDTDGVALTAHTGELGATWTALTGSAVVPTIQSNAAHPGTGSDADALYYTSGSPASADYSVTATVVRGTYSHAVVGPGLRLSTSAKTGYFAIHFGSYAVVIYKYVNGSLTAVGAGGVALAVTAGTATEITLSAVGTTLTVRVKRVSDGYWATSAGVWQVDPVDYLVRTDSSITAAGRAGFWLARNTAPSIIQSFSASEGGTGATATTLTGPTTGVEGVASANFTVGADAEIAGTVIVTPSDSGGGGAFTPTTVSISSGTPTGTFTYTPASAGAKTISTTNDGGLANPSSITYTASSAAATATTLTGPTSGTVGVASTNFTVAANGVITGTVIVTPSAGAGGGTFSPTTVSISAGTPTATFTYTPASAGTKTISTTNDGGLTNPASITYTATAAVKYTRVDATDTITGQAIMVLVPNSNAAVPYNSSNPTPVVLHVHGADENQTGLISDSLKAGCRDALLDAGYILAGSAANGNNWGNQASVDAYAALEKYLRDNYNVKSVALWGQSMGGLDTLSVISQGKIQVVGALLTYPVCSLANMAAGSYSSQINTAHGITGVGIATYANKTYGLDPALKSAHTYRDTPMRFYASPSDSTVTKAANTDVLAAIVAGTRSEAAVIACTGGHGDPSHFQPSDYAAFFARCFASSTRTITATVTSDGTSPIPSLTGLKWAVYEEATPGAIRRAPIASGTTETTDGSGVISISFTSSKSAGDVVRLELTDSDGTTTQSPAAKYFAGPVVLS